MAWRWGNPGVVAPVERADTWVCPYRWRHVGLPLLMATCGSAPTDGKINKKFTGGIFLMRRDRTP
ncbi:MAG: hypothetical protein HC769_22310 [Cyanobacteria bacterium CRU_2_1]|nr:hypothetical protein [Cyanobacteria bacterium CRU_2_1]